MLADPRNILYTLRQENKEDLLEEISGCLVCEGFIDLSQISEIGVLREEADATIDLWGKLSGKS